MDWLDFLNIYVMGSLQLFIGFHFFTKCLSARERPLPSALFTIMGMFVLTFMPTDGIVQFIVFVLLLVAMGIFSYKANGSTSALYAVIIVEIMQLCYGIFNSILCILYPWFLSFSPGNASPLTNSAAPGSIPSPIIGIIFMLLGDLALPTSVLCYHLVYKYFPSNSSRISDRHALLLLLPTLVIFFMGGYINSTVYGNTIVLDYNENLICNINMDHIQTLAIQMLGMASLFCVLYAYKKLTKDFKASAKLVLLEQESHLLQQYVEEAKTRYEKTKSFRHDVKNHVTIVAELLRNQKPEEALNYLNDMESLTADFSFPCRTNHPTVDILLENKLGIAKNEGIDTSCALKLPSPCSIKDIDFCIILSNALDNAIHACREMNAGSSSPTKSTRKPPLTFAPMRLSDSRGSTKYIHVDGTVQGDFILLKIQNSFSGGSLPRRGTGLSNIQAIAEKYHGTVEIVTNGTSFELNVLLIIPQEAQKDNDSYRRQNASVSS